MIRLNGYYLYTLATQIHPLLTLSGGQKLKDIAYILYVADGALTNLSQQSVIPLRTTQGPLQELQSSLHGIIRRVDNAGDEEISLYEAFSITQSATKFEAVLNAELSISDIYVVAEKGGFSIQALIFKAEDFFPPDLWLKAPDCMPDVRSATKCLAFELPTACGFHLFRACEAVLRVYWDAVSNKAPRPSDNNLGTYLRKMEEMKVGDNAVKTALRDLKNIHRNPLIHPEHSLDTLDDAVALFGQVRSVITRMLKEIPLPSGALEGALGIATAAAIVPQP